MGKLFLHGRTQTKEKTDAFAKLTVKCPLGVTVRAVSVGTSALIDAVSNNGIAVLNRLTEGEWDITILNTEYPPIKRVKIDSLDNEITLMYSDPDTNTNSIIEVTYPVGSICTCSNGTTVLTAPDTSGIYAFVLPNTGVWTVTSTDGTLTNSKEINISTDSQTVNVELRYPKLPVLSMEYPLDVTVTSGTSAVFNVVISEDGYPNDYIYRWYINDLLVGSTTEAIYERNTSEDTGIYSVRCDVVNEAGIVSTRAATMTVYSLPVLNVNYTDNIDLPIGDSTTLSVSINTAGYPNSYTYQWYKNGFVIDGATTDTYVYTKLDEDATDTVYCIVTNSVGSVQSSAISINTYREYLFNQGVFCSGSFDYYVYGTTQNSYISLVDGCIRIYADGPDNHTGFWLTPKINLAGKKKLVFRVPRMYHSENDVGYTSCGTWYFGIDTFIESDFLNPPDSAYTSMKGGNDTDLKFIVDISSYQEEYYIMAMIYRATYYTDIVDIDAIYLL